MLSDSVPRVVYEEERLPIIVMERIASEMQERGIDIAKMALLTDRTEDQVRRAMRDGANLRMIARMAHAMGMRCVVAFFPLPDQR